MEILNNAKNPSELVDKAILSAFGFRDKIFTEGLETTPGQQHFRRIAKSYLEKYLAVSGFSERGKTLDEIEAAFKERVRIIKELQDECFLNYFVHIDSITGASMRNQNLSQDYINWLYLTGKETTFFKEEIELPLNRCFYPTWERDEPFYKGIDLAFNGGSLYDRTYLAVFYTLAEMPGRLASPFALTYFRQAGIIQENSGTCRLLAHVLLGEKKIKADRLSIIDSEPDDELNRSIFELNKFLKITSHVLEFTSLISSSFKRQYNDISHSIDEYGNFTKYICSCLSDPEEGQVVDCMISVLSNKYVRWENGSSIEKYQNVYELLSLAMEVTELLKTSGIMLESKKFIELRKTFKKITVTRPLKEWFSKEYLPSIR